MADGRAGGAGGRHDAGGAGTKRPAAVDNERASEGGSQPATKKQDHGGRLEKMTRNQRRRLKMQQHHEQGR